MIYDLQALGAVLDGSPSHVDQNTLVFQQALSAAAVNPGPIYLPMGRGMVINNGALRVTAPNMVIRGEASMGALPSWGPTSALLGKGPGHTLAITQPGCQVKGLSFKSFDGAQNGADSFISVSATQVTLADLYMQDMNIGISLTQPWQVGGEFWIENVLMGGRIKVAPIMANAGNCAIQMRHVLAYADDPQPPYGVCVMSAGELIMESCDVDNCGCCLALIPGMDGGRPQNVSAIMISNSYFDNGNGPGCLFVQPKGSAWVANLGLANVWFSTVNNNGGQWSTDGIHLDGTQSVPPPGLKSISDVRISNCVGRNFLQHDGIYAIGVTGLSIVGCSFCSSYNGIQIGGPSAAMACSGTLVGNKCGNYDLPALGSPMPFSGGNQNYGILIQKSPFMIVAPGNITDGNGRGGIDILH